MSASHPPPTTPTTPTTVTSSVVVLVGGAAIDARVVSLLPQPAPIICADSGLDHALALGMDPSVVVGDLDSASSSALDHARSTGVTVHQYPVDKDATDTELALAAALALAPRRLVLVGGGGGDRLDHTLGALTALADPDLAVVPHVEAWWGNAHLLVAHGPRQVSVHGAPGDTVSLLPIAGPCSGVSTDGLRWPLHHAGLSATRSRGVSNELLASRATVHVEHGVLFVIRPDALTSVPEPPSPAGRRP